MIPHDARQRYPLYMLVMFYFILHCERICIVLSKISPVGATGEALEIRLGYVQFVGAKILD